RDYKTDGISSLESAYFSGIYRTLQSCRWWSSHKCIPLTIWFTKKRMAENRDPSRTGIG
ncbi:uncharacterized protein METZ01_LOCUS312993, partial [marine metagenome]